MSLSYDKCVKLELFSQRFEKIIGNYFCTKCDEFGHSIKFHEQKRPLLQAFWDYRLTNGYQPYIGQSSAICMENASNMLYQNGVKRPYHGEVVFTLNDPEANANANASDVTSLKELAANALDRKKGATCVDNEDDVVNARSKTPSSSSLFENKIKAANKSDGFLQNQESEANSMVELGEIEIVCETGEPESDVNVRGDIGDNAMNHAIDVANPNTNSIAVNKALVMVKCLDCTKVWASDVPPTLNPMWIDYCTVHKCKVGENKTFETANISMYLNITSNLNNNNDSIV